MTAPLLFITGASSGIGQAMALEWARRGGRLALVARRGDEMRAWAARQGWCADRAEVYVADARDLAAMTAAGRDCIAAQGLPDVVIASAGISVGVDMGDRGRPRGAALGRSRPTTSAWPPPSSPSSRRCANAAQRPPGGHRERRGHPRAARARGLFAEQGRRHQFLREPARRMPAVRGARRDDRARVYRYPADAAAIHTRCRS